MKTGPIITAVIAVAAMGGVVAAFVNNASPYVTIAQAKQSSDDHLHLSGDIIKGSVRNNLVTHTLLFDVKDAEGQVVTVEHKGEVPGNINEATRVVAIGGMKGTNFESSKLLVKCPSKYEAKKGEAKA